MHEVVLKQRRVVLTLTDDSAGLRARGGRRPQTEPRGSKGEQCKCQRSDAGSQNLLELSSFLHIPVPLRYPTTRPGAVMAKSKE